MAQEAKTPSHEITKGIPGYDAKGKYYLKNGKKEYKNWLKNSDSLKSSETLNPEAGMERRSSLTSGGALTKINDGGRLR